MLCNAIAQIEDARSPACVARLRIGDISLAITCSEPQRLGLDPHLLRFTMDSGEADIEVSVNWSHWLPRWRGISAFDSGAAWTLFRDGDDCVFDFASAALGTSPYKRMQVGPDFRDAEITLNRELLQGRGAVYPLEYPADELLITNYLASHGLGVEVHGCGLIDSRGKAQLFLGHSGAGKSTTARLWHSDRGAEILSDDRIILRLHDGQLWMYGTPWHGDGQFASANRAKVDRIFILQHGTENKFAALSNSRAVGEMFARCFPPFHSSTGLESTVEFLNSVAAAAPCYEFGFTPDCRGLEAVLRFHD